MRAAAAARSLVRALRPTPVTYGAFGAAVFFSQPRFNSVGVIAAQEADGGNAQASMKRVLVRNGEAAAPWLTKDRLLKEHAGAYTTARTVDKKNLFELSMHCSRLHKTARTILEQEASNTHEEARRFLDAAGPEGLKPLVRHEINAALQYLHAIGCHNDGDFQVTMLLTWDGVGDHTPTGRGLDILTFVQPLPSVEAMVDVEAHRAERKNPTIKDVQWVNDRQGLEELQRRTGVNEVLMYDGDGAVTEGLQTNFFACTADGTVLTAPDERVLAGTVRKVVLEVAQKHGIQVRFDCPNIHDLRQWDSCFICSTSRLAKPIRSLGAPEFSDNKHFPKEGSVAHHLEALVKEAIRSNSEPLSEVSD